jgi:hypothetical protein
LGISKSYTATRTPLWNRIFAAFAFLLLPVARLAQLNLGDRVPSGQIPKNNTSRCAATSSQSSPCVTDLPVHEVNFAAAGYRSKMERIQYLLTSDPDCKAKEGLHVGDWIEVSEDQVFVIDGWRIFGPKTKDGRRIVLGTALLGNEAVKFQDGTDAYLKPTRTGPPRVGKVQSGSLKRAGFRLRRPKEAASAPPSEKQTIAVIALKRLSC